MCERERNRGFQLNLLKCSGLLTGVVKNGSFKGLRDLKIKKFSLANGCFFVFSWYKCFQRHFFLATAIFCRGCVEFERLCFCVRTARIWSVKGALGVGGGGEEGLKTYTSLRTRDDMVL